MTQTASPSSAAAADDDTSIYAALTAASRSLTDDLKRDPATLARGLDRSYGMRPHLRVIGDAMAEVLAGEVDRLVILTPPQVGKSTLVAEWGAFWWLANRPSDDIVVASYAADLAVTRSKAVQDRIRMYGAEFGMVMKSEAVHDWRLKSGGHLRAVGVGGGLSGFPANLILVDDPHADRAQAESPRIRNGVHDWWSSTAKSRLQPDMGAVIAIQTRWHCLLPDSDILTPMGITPVKSITSGSVVLTSAGAQQVVRAEPRPHCGDVISIRTYGYPHELRVTPDHRVMTANDGWCEAGQLRALDWLAFPIPQGDASPGELRALLPPPTESTACGDVRLTGVRLPVTRDQLAADLATGMTYLQISQKYGRKTRASAFEWARFYDLTRTANHVLTGDPTSDPDFWRVVGYWLAEGTITAGRTGGSRNVVRWSFGYSDAEQRLADDVRDVLARYGLTVRQHMQRGGHSIVAKCSSAQLAELLARCGALAPGKVLPEELVHLPEVHARELLRGYWLGDGCDTNGVDDGAPLAIRPNAHRLQTGLARITSVSLPLLMGFYRLLPRLGIRPQIMRSGPVLPLPGICPKFELRFPLCDAPWLDTRTRPVAPHSVRIDGGRLLVKIRSISVDEYEGPVYDIETPAHDFVANNFLVHNCDDFAGRRLAEEGRLEEGGRWKVVHLPAIADPKFGPDPLGRGAGEPLTHPKIRTKDRAKLSAWWAEQKRTSIVRDWHSLYQGDPQPTEGAMVTPELLRGIRDSTTVVEPQKIAVAVDPSGGGRDVAGIVGGFLGDDKRLWITHDRSGVMASAGWSVEACLLAHETNAAFIIVETNFGGDMCTLAIRTAWQSLQREGRIPTDALPPQVKAVRAKQGKLLRAEPIAQQMVLDRVRLRGLFVDLEAEWQTWQPTDPLSPGRIDASVYLAYGLLPVPNTGSTIVVPSGQMPSSGLSPLGGRRSMPGRGGASGFGPLG